MIRISTIDFDNVILVEGRYQWASESNVSAVGIRYALHKRIANNNGERMGVTIRDTYSM